ncbi:MAG: efflux RND transporter periplasmic adaptor subunit [Candidatus Hydrogenedentes bacterium]|nr:efflux RND transporter periplasmic adaptor subunit [Candidatus Hydrogenedentota bacterium]
MNNNLLKFMTLAGVLPLFLVTQGCTVPETVAAQSTDSERRFPVAVTAAQQRNFEERIVVQGTLLAKTYAMVAPRVDGILTDMFVEDGQRVEADKTALFQIDKEVLEQAYEISLQDKAVAECARIDGAAQVAAAQAQYDKMKLDYERFTRLKEEKAITQDAMEQVDAGYKVAEAQLKRAKTAVKLYEEQEKKAVAALAISQKRLDDSLVYSPIDGFISYRGKKQGEFAGAGVPIVRVADTSVLEVSAFLPGEYYPRVKSGESRLRVTVSGIDLGELTVSYKSPEIQDQLRTFEVKCLVEAPPEGVVPGAMAQIEAVLDAHTSLGVPQEIIQVRENKSTVFVLDDGKAKAVEVRPGLSTDGWTEVVDSVLAPGDKVIVKGYNLVNDGTPVDVVGEE